LEASQSQINNERPLKTEQLVSAIPASELLSDVRLGKLNDSNNIDFKSYSFFSPTVSEDERTLLKQRLNQVELEFKKMLDDRAAIITMNEEQLESLIQERDALVEEQAFQSAER
jgi:hypothetical protein